MTNQLNRSESWYKNRETLKSYAEEEPLPPRFTVSPSDDLQEMEIADQDTMASTTVAIYAYRAVRKVLNELFR